ncbi:MAG: DUF1846 domain-containing protein [Candidatus Methanoplasma sp.]|jgi:uncharacterized protein (UPF0371 family)|nr:DUF1846 domain-containing protein [Candidatus Methanoplasma sp.]
MQKDSIPVRIGFDAQAYSAIQKERIKERISEFGGKLYMEFGGKLFDDHHASRVLPGFRPDSKIEMLAGMKDDIEAVIAINSSDILKNKVRGDLGITYDLEVMRMIGSFKSRGIRVGGVVLTRYEPGPAVNAFENRLADAGVGCFRHYSIEGYPQCTDRIASDDGFGRNDFIATERPLVLVAAPGPGSGKMAVCLSQMYHDNRRKVRSGYAKFETFPIWNLPLDHPVNIAYEAATADIGDVNMIDPFHFRAYGKEAVNYNRDVEAFPVLNSIMTEIYGRSPYNSPTDMGVNTAGLCITDDAVVSFAARMEIVRRCFRAMCDNRQGAASPGIVLRSEELMKRARVKPEDRAVIPAVRGFAASAAAPVCGIELNDGRMVIGTAAAAVDAPSKMMLKALKILSGTEDGGHLLPDDVIDPMVRAKKEILGNSNPALHADETIIALAIAAERYPRAKEAMSKLCALKGCEVHSSVMLSAVTEATLRGLGMNATSEPVYRDRIRYGAGP